MTMMMMMRRRLNLRVARAARVTQTELIDWQYRCGSRASDTMFPSALGLCLTFLVPYVTAQQTTTAGSFRNQKVQHVAGALNVTQISSLASLSNITQMNEALDNICIVRVVGSSGHKKVKDYLKNSMTKLGWTVETDIFYDKPPNREPLEFENIVAKLNPHARRYLALACHYDSKYTREGDFVGATDSAVPCAQLLNLATVMQEHLNSARTSSVSLMLIFFDGEEAFVKWGPHDSIYGARHLASKWHEVKTNYEDGTDITDLDKLDMLILLDLLGAPDPTFCSYFADTKRWYDKLVQAEHSLAQLRKFNGYSYENPDQRYFQPCSQPSFVEDDHIPFLRKNVPIIHLIPYRFPSFWHTSGDNRAIIDFNTTENLNKILRVFVASYLNLRV